MNGNNVHWKVFSRILEAIQSKWEWEISRMLNRDESV